MAFALALPVALSAIQSLIKFRGRLDTILSVNATTAGLPFSLPPAPQDHASQVDPMVTFFRREIGQNILTIRGLTRHWDAVLPDLYSDHVQRDLTVLLNAYYEACDVVPRTLGPTGEEDRFRAAKGPSKEMRLAYYIVESDRLSRNPAVTRVLLAAADTLLELGASNAGFFVSNPRTRAILESLLTEFAVKREWDDESEGHIFKLLLGSTAVAALEVGTALPDKPVLNVLFAALADLRETEGTDFVAQLLTRDGVHSLVSRCLIHSADHPALLHDQPLLRQSLVAMLRTAGSNLDGVLGQPRALAAVLEAGIAAAATEGIPLVDQRIGDQPLLAAVLKTALNETQRAAGEHTWFQTLADGQFFTSLYNVALRSVAYHPAALAKQAGLDTHVAAFIAGCVRELASAKLQKSLSLEQVRAVAVRALDQLAIHPEMLDARGVVATRVLGAALLAVTHTTRNGFTTTDSLEITDAVVLTAANNPSLLDLNDRLQPVVSALADSLDDAQLASFTTAAVRKAAFLAGLNALATNARTWGNLAARDLAEPLVTAIIRALAVNPGGLLAGPALVSAFQQTLEAAARRGRAFIEARTTPGALEVVLTSALQSADAAVGESIDGKTLPVFLQRVVLAFLASPFDVTVQRTVDEWIEHQLLAVA
jgi:hypothetical protein